MHAKKFANAVLKEIIKLIVEFDSAQIKPNTLLLTKVQYEALKQEFPYFIEDNYFIYNKQSFQIVVNTENKLGMSLVFYSNGVVI